MKTIISLFCLLLVTVTSYGATSSKKMLACPNAPRFAFYSWDNNYGSCGEGSVYVSAALCPDSYTGTCTINSVKWNMGDGTIITTATLDVSHTYAASGDYNVSAKVTCSLSDGSVCEVDVYRPTSYNTNLALLCRSFTTYTTLPIVATVFDVGINVLPVNGLGQNYTTATPINFAYSFLGNLAPSIGGGTTAKIYVDGNLLQTLSYPFSSGTTSPATTYSEGQHTVEIVVFLKDATIPCTYSASAIFEIFPVETSCPGTCFTFQPKPGERYWVSAWMRVAVTSAVKTYADLGGFVEIGYTGDASLVKMYPSGEIIDGWQRITGEFTVPATNPSQIKVSLVNNGTVSMYFDDIRIHPFNASLKSYVYDPSTYWLLAELDDNNYATIYEYDMEGQLIRIKKETERGIMTIQESRSKNAKN